MNFNQIYNFIIMASVYGSITGIIILLIRAVFSKVLTAKFRFLLWYILIIKLICPSGPESRISIYNASEYFTQAVATNTFTQLEAVHPKNLIMSNHYDILIFLWLAGFMIMISRFLITGFILKLKLKKTGYEPNERIQRIFENCKEKLKIKKFIKVTEQDCIKGASLFGIIKPEVLINSDFESLDDKQLEFIFIHELSHYKRKDNILNCLIYFIQSCHWFNPIIWVLFKKARQDMELATDGKTMSYLHKNEYNSYGLTLITILERYSGTFFSAGLLNAANNKNNIRKRIRNIAKYKQKTIASVLISLIVLTFTGTICLTGAQEILPEETVTKIISFPPRLYSLSYQQPEPDILPEIQPVESEAAKPEETPLPDKEAKSVEIASPKALPDIYSIDHLPGTDMNYMISLTESEGKIFSAVQPCNLKTSYIIVDFTLNLESNGFIFNCCPNTKGEISFYINTDSVDDIYIVLTDDNAPVLKAVVSPTKLKSYLFTGLDKEKNYTIQLFGNIKGKIPDVKGKALIY